MAIVINGSGTVTGISVGGLPDGIVDAGTLATNSVDSAELIDGAVDNSHMAAMAASKLTGALPAISGASLTGITTGKVLQVLASNVTGTATTTSSSYVASALWLAITPSATSSKVLVICTGGMNGFAGGSGGTGNFTLFKDVGGGGYNECTPATTRGMCTLYKHVGDDYGPIAISYLDSPSTTSAVTYKVYMKRSAGDGTLSLNRDGNGLCMIQCLEIGA
jgi:hypothetical protein